MTFLGCLIGEYLPSLCIGGLLSIFAGNIFLNYVPTPANVPYESFFDMTYPWLPGVAAVVGGLLLLEAMLGAATKAALDRRD